MYFTTLLSILYIKIIIAKNERNLCKSPHEMSRMNRWIYSVYGYLVYVYIVEFENDIRTLCTVHWNWITVDIT